MNFIEYRLNKKFNSIDAKYHIKISNVLNKIEGLNEIPYNITGWLSVSNKLLYYSIINQEKELINVANNAMDSKKFNKLLKTYAKYLQLLVKFYKINKMEADTYINKMNKEVICISSERTTQGTG